MSKCIILTKHTKARMTTLSMQQNDHYTQSNYPTCALSMITGPKRTMQRCRFVFFLPGSTDCQKLCFWKAFPIQSWHCPQHVQITLAFKAGLWTRDFLSAIFWSFLLSFFCISLSSPCCLPSGTAADDVLLNLTNASWRIGLMCTIFGRPFWYSEEYFFTQPSQIRN